MDSYAALDGAQIYRLVRPVSPRAMIPFGEAASEPQPVFGPPGFSQRQQVEHASSLQSGLWAAKALWNLRTNGRAEETAKALMEDVIRDAASTYRLVVQPSFACPDPARFRPVRITAKPANILLFAPAAIQMIPSEHGQLKVK